MTITARSVAVAIRLAVHSKAEIEPKGTQQSATEERPD